MHLDAFYMFSYEFGDGVMTILIVVPVILHYPWETTVFDIHLDSSISFLLF